MDVSTIPPRTDDGNVRVLVEIPKGTRNKYEYNEEFGVMALDRTLYSAVYYPAEYGFVPCTRGEDGEKLDMLILAEEPTFPGCLVEACLIGMLTISHTDGKPEYKLLGVPVHEPRFEEYKDISDVRPHVLREIEHFFSAYKDLEGSDIGVHGWKGKDEAEKILVAAIRSYGEA